MGKRDVLLSVRVCGPISRARAPVYEASVLAAGMGQHTACCRLNRCPAS